MRLITLLAFALIMLLAAAVSAQDAVPEAVEEAVEGALPDTAAAAVGLDTETAGIAAPAYPMDPERKAKLISYSRFVNIWRFASFFITIAVLSLILFTGFSAKMRTWAQKAFRRKVLIVAGFMVMFTLVDFLLNLPFEIYRGYVVESNYGFMNQSFGGWFKEHTLGMLISIVIGTLAVYFLYWVINRFRRWWLVFTIGAIPFAIFFIVIAPVVISPLFNNFVPIQDKELGTKLVGLAESVGIHDADVFQVNASKQSSKINAYVTGLFGSKRIVLYDTMINNFTHDEILFVMGHEMGHYVKQHIWWGLLIAIGFITLLLWVTNRTIHPVIRRFQGRFGFNSLGDIASLPLLLLFVTVFEFAFQPITNTYSRVQERVCDRYGIDITGVDGETAARAFDKLSVFNLSDPSPSPMVEFWFYDHPALDSRMAFVRAYAAQKQAEDAIALE